VHIRSAGSLMAGAADAAGATHFLGEDIRAQIPQRDLELARVALELELDDDQRVERHRDVGRHWSGGDGRQAGYKLGLGRTADCQRVK